MKTNTKKIATVVFVMLLATQTSWAYTINDIDLSGEAFIGSATSGDNTAIVVVDYSDTPGDEYAFAVHFTAATVTGKDLLDEIQADTSLSYTFRITLP